MVMVTQALPGPGKRSFRTGLANSDVAIAQDRLAATRLGVQVKVSTAFYNLLLAQDELRIHDEPMDIARPGHRGGPHPLHRGQSLSTGHSESATGDGPPRRAHDPL